MKRGNENAQLRAEEVEALENESEEAGTFARASTNVISQRKIVRAGSKRAIPAPAAALEPLLPPKEAVTLGTSGPANPFASFSGLTQPVASANPFAGFKGLVATTTSAPAPAPAPALASALKPAVVASSGFSFGGSSTATSETSAASKPSTLSSFISAAFDTTSKPPTPAAASSVDGDDEGTKKMKKLNQAFLQWMEHQLKEQPNASWKNAVQEYIKYAAEIESKYGAAVTVATVAVASSSPTKSSSAPSITNTTSASTSFGFGGFCATAPASAPITALSTTVPAAAPAPAPLFTFGAASTSASSSSSSTAFSLPKTTTAPAASSFSFSLPSTTTTSASTAAAATESTKGKVSFDWGGPGLKTATTATTAGFTGFSMPGSSSSFSSTGTTGFAAFTPAAASTAAAGAGGDDGEGGGDEGGDGDAMPMMEPEKVLRNADDTDEILFESNCKLHRFSKEDKEWKDNGKGVYRVTKAQDTGKKRMLVRNDLGKVIFNAYFYKAMKIEKQKSGITFAAVIGASGELQKFMLKLKSDSIDKAIDVMDKAIADL